MFDELKPCPFCGGKAPIVVKEVQYPDTPHARTWYAVECNACDAVGDGDLSESGAVEKWNTRPGESALRAEIIKWIEAGNAGTALINEQRALIRAQDERIEQLLGIIQAAHNTFTQGGTDPADDDVISVLMAKILEEALT